MPGETVTVAEAAGRLGVNEKTVRRWVKAGRLAADLADGPYGKQYRIPADALQNARQALAVVTVDRGADPRSLALAVAQALEPQTNAMHARIEGMSQEISALRAIIEERLPMPVQGVQTPLDTPESPPASPTSTKSEKPAPNTRTAFSWPSIPLYAVLVVVAAVVALVLVFVPR